VTSNSNGHRHPHADTTSENAEVTRIQRIAMFLEAHFGEVELHMPERGDDDDFEQDEDNSEPSLLVRMDEADAQINLASMVH
jgi:cleavage and polyadenylation specificity factor subunit 3